MIGDGKLTGAVIGAAISVHRELGPGLDEIDYELALGVELAERRICHRRQVPLPLMYRGKKLDCGYRMDFVAEDSLVIEVKAAETLHPLHEAQLLSYLRLTGIRVGLLMNFNSLLLRDGIKRRVDSGPGIRVRSGPESVTDDFDRLSREIVAAAIRVQEELGPGLLRSAYETCLACEMRQRGFRVDRALPVELAYHGLPLPRHVEIPMMIEGSHVVSCLCVKELTEIHFARHRSHQKAARANTGMCLNFHSKNLACHLTRITLPEG